MAPHTAKIHTLITLGIRHRAKPLVFKPQNPPRVGSIPIARSTLRQRQATQGAGLQDWDQDIDHMRCRRLTDCASVEPQHSHVGALIIGVAIDAVYEHERAARRSLSSTAAVARLQA